MCYTLALGSSREELEHIRRKKGGWLDTPDEVMEISVPSSQSQNGTSVAFPPGRWRAGVSLSLSCAEHELLIPSSTQREDPIGSKGGASLFSGCQRSS